ncbi:MAG TPA: aldose epimerase family protein [Devosia sp.]|nr:aldose epimerase family protein [Devosia sp.]
MLTYRIGTKDLAARVSPFGATLVDLRLRGWEHPLVLGFDRHDDYALTDHYAGAVIGRHANRIAGGRAEIDGQVIQLPTNSGGHHLHGGATGLARQSWEVVDAQPGALVLHAHSADGHEGYPGNCDFQVRYEVADQMTLRLTFEAKTDRATLVNLCHHPYFNFSGRPDIRDHRVQINADSYLVSGNDLVPTGEVRAVTGTAFDFREEREIGPGRPMPGFNHNFCLADHARPEVAYAARLSVPGGPAMELWTTQPGVHLYSGYKLEPGQRGLEGREYGPDSGVCLEAQNWPDSPNHPAFPSALLRAGETYHQVTEYRFMLPA